MSKIEMLSEGKTDLEKAINESHLIFECIHCDKKYDVNFGGLKFRYTGAMQFLCTSCNKISTYIGSNGDPLTSYQKQLEILNSLKESKVGS